MAKLSLNKQFIADSLDVLKRRGIKGLLFGHSAELSKEEKGLVAGVKEQYIRSKKQGGRKGRFTKIDAVHRGSGTAYLIPQDKKSALVFSSDSKVTNGPDLWVYLSTSTEPKKSLGDFKNLGLIKGTKGGQVYEINTPLSELKKYESVIIYCKQFEVLFSYAILS